VGSGLVDEEKDSHSDGQAIGHLSEYDAVGAVGHFAFHLDASVDGAGMHDKDIRAGLLQPLDSKAIEVRVFADGREGVAAHTLKLDAKHVDDIQLLYDAVEAVAYLDRQLRDFGGHQGGRRDERDLGTELGHGPDVAACDARMRDITDDGYLEALKALTDLSNGVDVKECLRWVFAVSITGVNDTGVDIAGDQMWRSGSLVANDDDIDAHRLEIAGSIKQRLALADRAVRLSEFDGISAEAAGGKSETVAGAGAVLEEEIDDDFAAERRGLFYGTSTDLLESFGSVKNMFYLLAGQVTQPQEVLSLPHERFLHLCCHATSLRTYAAAGSTSRRFLFDHYLVNAIGLDEIHPDIPAGLDIGLVTPEISLYRELTAGSLNENGKAHGPGSPQVDQGIHGCPSRAAGIEDIIDQDDELAVYIENYVCGPDLRLLAALRVVEVIAIHCDVECAALNLPAEPGREELREPLGKYLTPASDTDDGDLGAGWYVRCHGVAQLGDGLLHLCGVKNCFHHSGDLSHCSGIGEILAIRGKPGNEISLFLSVRGPAGRKP